VPDPDANAFASADHRPMTTGPGATRLILLIDLDADPINGSLQSADGRTRGFVGWIGLAATLNAIRDGEDRPGGHRDGRKPKDT
jgi:hypothetical protein